MNGENAKTDAQKTIKIPGLPPEDELRERMRRIKRELEEGFERLKKDRNYSNRCGNEDRHS